MKLIPSALLLQAPVPQTPWDMVIQASLPTMIVLGFLAAFSFASWVLIFWKWRQFKRVREEGDRFVDYMERAQDLAEAYRAIITLPESPYGRVFRQGVNFFTELRPGALKKERGEISEDRGLTPAQLEALRMVLEKEEAEERDELAHGLTWLAIIGSISPLLGLMGTVIGIMYTFLGITQAGSANIGAVAPGVAEALITTVVGLAVAIPAVIAYNHFVARLNLVSGELEGFSSEFIGTLAREGRV
ncbi:MAG: MotA/TolQ/ExbB proton channel family protein [Gemmatimonadota bacterium]